MEELAQVVKGRAVIVLWTIYGGLSMFTRVCSCRQEDTLCATCNSREPLDCGQK